MKNKIELYKNLLYIIAEQSECKSRKVGAILVVDGRVVAEGWNSPPKKVSHEECIRCSRSEHSSGTNLSDALCTHAEMNCISSAAYLGFSTKGASLYCTAKPCSECAKMISACGITNVFYMYDYFSLYTDLIFKAANIFCEKI